jgi:anti-anti-sigma regulatory factor
VFTDLGLESVQFLYWIRDRHRDSPPLDVRALVHSVSVHPTAKRLAMLGSVVASFALGAGLGAIAYVHVPHWAMYLPVAFLLWIVVHDIRIPICEIEPSELVGGDHGLSLPPAMAVYHLRKDSGRSGKVQRLPDLLRWCERLPAACRIVILDLGDVTVLDSNAALELRALMKQSAARGRRLVISGISGEQYNAMRAAGAGDTLDPTNVCADLELAIARGLTLLDGIGAAR